MLTVSLDSKSPGEERSVPSPSPSASRARVTIGETEDGRASRRCRQRLPHRRRRQRLARELRRRRHARRRGGGDSLSGAPAPTACPNDGSDAGVSVTTSPPGRSPVAMPRATPWPMPTPRSPASGATSSRSWARMAPAPLTGAGGNDTLAGGTGYDMLAGSAGADRLMGGAEGDTFFGPGGADVFVVARGTNLCDRLRWRDGPARPAGPRHGGAVDGPRHAGGRASPHRA